MYPKGLWLLLFSPIPTLDPDDRLVAIVTDMRQADRDLTPASIATGLEIMRERTPGSNSKRHPSTVRLPLQRSEKMKIAGIGRNRPGD
jgi:hypothetical protein